MPFCYSPWTNIDISPGGSITPCCKFHSQENKFNIQFHSIEEYKQSKFINGIKQQFLNDQWPAECERCRIEENNNIDSKRLLDNTRWKEYYQKYNLLLDNFITASVAFGNTCNLTCITCGPGSSSRWQKEYQHIYGKDIVPFKFYKKNFVKDFVSAAPNILHIDIPGGEPFLSGIQEQKELLKHYIRSDQAKKISLHYTTNATVWPDDEWWQLWQHFKEIDLQLSIDGINQRYEYIRYPAVWTEVIEHIKLYLEQQSILSNFKLSVSHTVSAYNIYYLDEFFTWCYNIGLPRPWLGRVHNPIFMRPTVWPEHIKNKIINKLNSSQHQDTRSWIQLLLNEDDSKYFDEFKTKTQKHDWYRKLNFASAFPELETYLNETLYYNN